MKRSSIYSPEHRVMVMLLRDLRLEKGLTQEDVGAAVGLPQTKISAMEMGRRGLDYLQVRELVELYGLTMAEFAIRLDENIAAKPYRPPQRPRRDASAKPKKSATRRVSRTPNR